MPRGARTKCSSNVYHVMLRGANRQQIFEDDEDYTRFLEILDESHVLSIVDTEVCIHLVILVYGSHCSVGIDVVALAKVRSSGTTREGSNDVAVAEISASRTESRLGIHHGRLGLVVCSLRLDIVYLADSVGVGNIFHATVVVLGIV